MDGPAPMPEAHKFFVDLFDALFPQDRARFFEWADSSWYGTLGELRYEFERSPEGFGMSGAEFVGGLLRAGYRLDSRDPYGRDITDPRRARCEGQWSSGPWGA